MPSLTRAAMLCTVRQPRPCHGWVRVTCLAGSIAGLLSQDVPLEGAAVLGVYLHGLAGERVCDRLGDTGMVASDLLPELPLAIKALRSGKALRMGKALREGNGG